MGVYAFGIVFTQETDIQSPFLLGIFKSIYIIQKFDQPSKTYWLCCCSHWESVLWETEKEMKSMVLGCLFHSWRHESNSFSQWPVISSDYQSGKLWQIETAVRGRVIAVWTQSCTGSDGVVSITHPLAHSKVCANGLGLTRKSMGPKKSDRTTLEFPACHPLTRWFWLQLSELSLLIYRRSRFIPIL